MATHDHIPSDWEYLQVSRTDLIGACRECPDQPYLSVTIPASTSGNRVVVRRVQFTTNSRDQGWADASPELNGTYADSWTYFEIRVIDANGYDRVPREMLTTNVRAYPHFKQHVVCWDFRDERQRTDETGRLLGWAQQMVPSRWVSSLRGGDEIRIIPQAEWAAWTNYVASAKIELWVEQVPLQTSHGDLFPKDAYLKFRPLREDQKEIRLVVLDPTNGEDDARPPHLRVIYTNLSDPNHQRYEALSYCWGDAHDTAPIVLSQDNTDALPMEVSIGGNLQRALKRLQSKSIPRIFWIDLLCINQDNLEELSSQVKLMGQIYSSAESVTVWIGELDEFKNTQQDLLNLRAIGSHYSHGPSDTTQQYPTVPETHSQNHLTWGNQLSNRPIFLRPWFRRVWVLQEVFNASASRLNSEGKRRHDVTVQCGDIELPWWIFMQAAACLNEVGSPAHVNVRMPSLWTDLFPVADRASSPRNAGMPGPRLDILTLVIKSLELNATDPRDRIFALLTFGLETHDLMQNSPLITPNYEKTVAQVYADFTIWWIQEHGSLRILSAVHALRDRTWLKLTYSDPENNSDHAELFQEKQSHPSWTLWYNKETNWQGEAMALDESVPYRACGERTVDLDLLTSDVPSHLADPPNWAVPALKGVRISTIASKEPFPIDGSISRDSEIYHTYLKVLDPCGELRGVKGWALRNDPRRGQTPHHVGVMQSIMTHKYAHQAISHHHGKESLPCHGDCMFKTEDGRLGLCPAPSRPGDIVVILYGGRVPYLLRPRESTTGFYTFIGECFLDGVMQGEAVDANRDFVEDVFRLV